MTNTNGTEHGALPKRPGPSASAEELDAYYRARDAESERQRASVVGDAGASQGPRKQLSIPTGDALDAFSRQIGPAITGDGGARPRGPEHGDGEGAPVEGEGASDDAPPREDLRATLAANTWAAQSEELQRRVLARADGNEAPIPTPWESFNARMGGGLWPGFHVLVGGTGSGKSQWAMQVAIHAAKEHRIPVLVLSLELDALGVFARAASFVTMTARTEGDDTLRTVPWSSFYTGGYHHDEARAADNRANIRAALPVVAPVLESLPVHWYEAPPHGLPYTRLRSIASALRELHPEHTGPVLVVLDFLQLVAGKMGEREDSITRVSQAAYQCRAIARELGAVGAVVLALSSTSRENASVIRDAGNDAASARTGAVRKGGAHAGKPVRKPFAGTLVGLGKESGDVEFSADSVMVLVPEPRDDDEPQHQGGNPVHLAVAKLRAGTPGWCELRFNGTRFAEPSTGPRCERCGVGGRIAPRSSGGLMCTGCGGAVESSVDGTAGDDAGDWNAAAATEKPSRGKRAAKGARAK